MYSCTLRILHKLSNVYYSSMNRFYDTILTVKTNDYFKITSLLDDFEQIKTDSRFPLEDN